MLERSTRMVGILSRVPRLGRGKSRLAAAVGAEAAVILSRAFLLDTAQALGRDRRWTSVLFVDPPGATDEAATLTGIADTRPQSGGSIGRRLAAAAASLAADGAHEVVLVGSDAPIIEANDVAQAFDELGRYDIVFGPARDGGYYAVGMGRTALDAGPESLFSDAIRWSTDTVLEASEHIAHELGWSVTHTRPLTDVDSVQDLASVHRDSVARPEIAVHTRDTLRALDEWRATSRGVGDR